MDIQIGQPVQYPTEMVKALCALFQDFPSVNNAYLAWVFNPSSGEPPHLMIALDVHGDSKEITQRAGLADRQFLKQEEIIDFIQIDHSSGISNYFTEQTTAFYKRELAV